MGKGEIARYEQFLLSPQCFQKACFPGASKGVVWEWIKPGSILLKTSKAIFLPYAAIDFSLVLHPQNECFRGYVLESACLSVRPFVHVSVCVQKTSFCQSGGVGIKSYLVTAVVFFLYLVLEGKNSKREAFLWNRIARFLSFLIST